MRDQKGLRIAGCVGRVPRRFGDDRRWGVGRGARNFGLAIVDFGLGELAQIIFPLSRSASPRLRVTLPRPDAGSVPSSKWQRVGFVRFMPVKPVLPGIARFKFLEI